MFVSAVNMRFFYFCVGLIKKIKPIKKSVESTFFPFTVCFILKLSVYTKPYLMSRETTGIYEKAERATKVPLYNLIMLERKMKRTRFKDW